MKRNELLIYKEKTRSSRISVAVIFNRILPNITQIHPAVALRRNKSIKELTGQNKIINTEFEKTVNRVKENFHPVFRGKANPASSNGYKHLDILIAKIFP